MITAWWLQKGNGWLIVERGLQLELFGVFPDAEIFTDEIGRRMMNGAMAVTKTCRSRDGTEVHGQRFISVFATSYAYSRCLRGDSKSLPIISRVSQVMLGDGEWLSMDTEDMPSAFNLFEIASLLGSQSSCSKWRYRPASWVETRGARPCGCTHPSDGMGRCRGYCTSHGWTDRFCHR